MTRAAAGWLLRLAVTGAAVGWLLSEIDGPALLAAFRRTAAGGVVIAGLLYAAAFLAAVVRWHLLLRPIQPIRFRRVLRWCLLGAFFNTLLPTTIGGDVVRIHEAGVALRSQAQAAASVLLDRLTGFTAMFAIGLTATVAALSQLQPPLVRGMLRMAALFGLLVLVLMSRRLFRHATKPLGWLRLHRLQTALREWQHSLHAYGRHPAAVGWALGLSVIVQGGSMALYGVVARAMALPIPWWAIFVFVPILMMIAMLPISLNGLGVRESAAVVLLGTLGVGRAEALALSLLCAAIPALSGLAGAGAFLSYRREQRAA